MVRSGGTTRGRQASWGESGDRPVEDSNPRARQLTPSARGGFVCPSRPQCHQDAAGSHAHDGSRRLLPLTLTALGVVYGDIGTSPLYALRECFFGSHSVPPTHENVLGVLSLIIYSLLLVISIKYVAIVMRADNQGEGGVLALTALDSRPGARRPGTPRLAVGRPILIALGIFGTALLYGDGMITPAISVLGAIEGLEVATPLFQPYVVPITVVILVGLFVIQKYGTHRLGGLFGPIMVLWFATLAVLGVVWTCDSRRCSAPSTRATPSTSSTTTASSASRCLARCFWWSRAGKRCTRTWGISASIPSGWPGSRWCSPRWS